MTPEVKGSRERQSKIYADIIQDMTRRINGNNQHNGKGRET